MTIASCAHGMPSPASCVTCIEDGPVAPPTRSEPVTVVATFRARFDGQCPGCNLPIVPGQIAHILSDERRVHQGCE